VANLPGTKLQQPVAAAARERVVQAAGEAFFEFRRVVGRFEDKMPMRGKAQTLTRHGWSTLHRRVVVKTFCRR